MLYVMDWSVPVKADTPFETANGYEITLSEASLNHWIVQLTPCQPSSESLELGLNLSTLAWAGHSVGDEALEVSQVLGPMSEDLTEGGPWVLSPRGRHRALLLRILVGRVDTGLRVRRSSLIAITRQLARPQW